MRKLFVLFINIALFFSISYSQTCLVDTLIKELDIDSAKYSNIELKYIYPDTIGFQTDFGYIKVWYQTTSYMQVFNENVEMTSKNDSKSLVYGNMRYKSNAYLFDSNWVILTIPLELGYDRSDFIVINLPTNTYFTFSSISSNAYLLNDYDKNGTIDFIQVDLELLVHHKSIAAFYKAIISLYTYKEGEFELQNIKIPKNKNIFVHEKCGCYTKK